MNFEILVSNHEPYHTSSVIFKFLFFKICFGMAGPKKSRNSLGTESLFGASLVSQTIWNFRVGVFDLPVDGTWDPWTDWNPCNETCGGGWSFRTRECNAPLHNGDPCPGPSDDWKECNTHHCPSQQQFIDLYSKLGVCTTQISYLGWYDLIEALVAFISAFCVA